MTTLSNHLRASVLFVLNLLTMLPLKKNRVLEYPYKTLIGKLMKFIILVVAIALTIFYFARNSINKKEAVENIAIGKDFLAKNKTIEGVIETASGLQYQVLQKGEGSEHPSASTRALPPSERLFDEGAYLVEDSQCPEAHAFTCQTRVRSVAA